MKYKLRYYQQQASDAAVRYFNGELNKYHAIEVLPTGCHAKGSKILMYDGTFKNVEDIVIGDYLMGENSEPRKVLELHRGIDKMYDITPIKGESFTVNGGHILSLYKTCEGSKYECEKSRIDEISVEDYISQSNNYKHLHKLYKPIFIDFVEKQPVIEPYFLGLYLGDGSSVCGVNITTQRNEVVDFLYKMVAKYDMKVSKYVKPNNLALSYAFSNIKVNRSNSNKIIDYLDKLNLKGVTSGFKFIPFEYKTSSRTERLELLAGLLDTDAYYDKCTFEYCSKSIQLSKDIVFLCRSLGFFAQIGKTKIVNGEKYYRIQISGDLDTIPTKVGIRKAKQRDQKKNVLVTGFDVKYKGKGNYYGFTTDGNHLYCDYQFFVHHNSGKSLIIADIASKLSKPTIVLQPQKEILEQNFAKLKSYGVEDCSIYSASMNKKDISRLTFATIGSIANHMEDFSHFRNVIIDECHACNPKGGQYKDFIEDGSRKVLGLTATPYRLDSISVPIYNDKGEIVKDMFGEMEKEHKAILRFLTRCKPKIFYDVIYHCQVSELIQQGYLAQIRYCDATPEAFLPTQIKRNTTGRDFDDISLESNFQYFDIYTYLVKIIKRILNPKPSVNPRRGILVFTKNIAQAEALTAAIPNCACVTGDTKKKDRELILKRFKEGDIKVLSNVGVLTTGFDYPELDTVVIARPTMSLAMYYQIIGRGTRPFPGKDFWLVDLCGNIKTFGRVENLNITCPARGQWAINGWVDNQWKQLTNTIF